MITFLRVCPPNGLAPHGLCRGCGREASLVLSQGSGAPCVGWRFG
jgi:hypothetical protein